MSRGNLRFHVLANRKPGICVPTSTVSMVLKINPVRESFILDATYSKSKSTFLDRLIFLSCLWIFVVVVVLFEFLLFVGRGVVFFLLFCFVFLFVFLFLFSCFLIFLLFCFVLFCFNLFNLSIFTNGLVKPQRYKSILILPCYFICVIYSIGMDGVCQLVANE